MNQFGWFVALLAQGIKRARLLSAPCGRTHCLFSEFDTTLIALAAEFYSVGCEIVPIRSTRSPLATLEELHKVDTQLLGDQSAGDICILDKPSEIYKRMDLAPEPHTCCRYSCF